MSSSAAMRKSGRGQRRLEPRYLLRLCSNLYRWLSKNSKKNRKIHHKMRRSKRLAAKKAIAFSGTERSSEEEPTDIESPDIGALVSKPYDDTATDGKEEVDDEDVSSERIFLSSQEDDEPGKAEEFLSLPTEFKRKLKE